MRKRTKGRKPKKRSVWVKLGRKGGKARAARLTPAERRRIAMLGVEARRAKKAQKNAAGKPGLPPPWGEAGALRIARRRLRIARRRLRR